jgi:hypothetical protein
MDVHKFDLNCRCERVEAELGRARDKLRDLEYLKSLTGELQSDNR